MNHPAMPPKTNGLILKLAVVIGLIVSVSGCTSKQLYNAVQENRLQECRKLYGAQRDECEARYQKDYETYQREREEVIANKQ